jgi:uncharacterized membrane protein YdjX (TVP38/TMEM64 family)
MMLDYAIALLLGLLIPAVAIPYVGRTRHAEQRPLAAYLIFITVVVAAATLMSGVLWHAGQRAAAYATA